MTTISRVRTVKVGAERIVSVDCQDDLDAGELLSGFPAVEEDVTSDLTISNAQISTTQLIINKRIVPIGMAVLFEIEGQQANTTYVIKVTVNTTVGQVLVFDLTVRCIP